MADETVTEKCMFSSTATRAKTTGHLLLCNESICLVAHNNMQNLMRQNYEIFRNQVKRSKLSG